ncbi:hypothetical protein [Argonema galeatum]|nr:hypothetical protein [Argonema galeatum]
MARSDRDRVLEARQRGLCLYSRDFSRRVKKGLGKPIWYRKYS